MAEQKRFYTLLIVAPHGQLRKIRIPQYVLHLGPALGLMATVALAILASSYARMLLKVANYNHVREEREALKTQYHTLQSIVTSTNAKLISLESLASEVAMSYGFGRSSRPRFPEAILALATESDSTLESSYDASLYTFNLMKTAALKPAPNSLALGMVPAAFYERAKIPSLWPVRGRVTAGFGERMDPLGGEGEFHAGIDISAPRGTPVEAAGGGVVLEATREAGYGNEILIDHGDGIATKYGHLSEIDVVVGQEVKSGEIIGTVGTTGKTTGPHLHYEVLVHDTPVNPSKFLGG